MATWAESVGAQTGATGERSWAESVMGPSKVPWYKRAGGWGLRKLGEQVGEEHKIYSGKTGMDILDTLLVGIGAYPGMGMLKEAAKSAREIGPMTGEGARPIGEQLSMLGQGVRRLPGAAWRGIKERASYGDVVEQEFPEFSEKHPWLAGGLGLAGDIGTMEAGAALTRPLFKVASAGAAASARAGLGAAERVPQVGRALATFRKIGPAIERGDIRARAIRGARELPAAELEETITESGKYVDYIARATDDAMSGVYGPAGDRAVKTARFIRTQTRIAKGEVTRSDKLYQSLTKRADAASREGPKGAKPFEFDVTPDGAWQLRGPAQLSKIDDLAPLTAGQMKAGQPVVALDRGNVGKIVSVEGGTARVHFFNRETGLRATVRLPVDQLRTADTVLASGRMPGTVGGPATFDFVHSVPHRAGEAGRIARQAVEELRGLGLRHLEATVGPNLEARVVQGLERSGALRPRGAIEPLTGVGPPRALGQTSEQLARRPALRTAEWEGPLGARQFEIGPGPPPYSMQEKLQRKAVAALEGREAAKAKLQDLVKQAQELGMTEAQATGRYMPGPKAFAKIADMAEQGAIPQAHAAADAAIEAGLSRIARVTSPEHAAEVGGIIKRMQRAATVRGRRAVATGARAPEEIAKYGKHHLWRGFERYTTPEAEIARLRAGGEVEAAAELAEQNARIKQFFGGGAPRSGMPGWRKYTRSTHLERPQLRELGELSAAERFARTERMAAVETAEAWRLGAVKKEWALSKKAWRELDDVAKEGYAELPDTMRWGPFKDVQYIPKWLVAHLGLEIPGGGWEKRIARLVSWGLPAQPGEARNVWATVVSTWKFFKVPSNLPTETRNVVTNTGMTYMVGRVPGPEVGTMLARGAKAFVTRSPEYRNAVRLNPGFRATMRQAEMLTREALKTNNAFEGYLNALWKSGKKAADRISGAYEFAEVSSKMAVYLYWTDAARGAARLAPNAAAKLAMAAVFDYGNVSRILNVLRRYGIAPFLTYPVKATKALVPAMMKTPERFGKIRRIMQAPERMLPDRERQQIEASLPEYAEGRIKPFPLKAQQQVSLPIQTKQGDRLTMGVGYFLPWGPWTDGMGMSPMSLLPIPQVMWDIGRNESAFTGRPVYTEDMGNDLAAMEIGEYIANALGPSWITRNIPIPSIGGLPARPGAIGETLKPGYRYGAPPEAVSAQRTGRAIAGEVFGVRTKAYSPTREMEIHEARMNAKIADIDKTIRYWDNRWDAGEADPETARNMIARAEEQKNKLELELEARWRRFAGAAR